MHSYYFLNSTHIVQCAHFMTWESYNIFRILEINCETEIKVWQKFMWMISILLQVFLAVEVPLCVIVVLHMISSAWIDFLDYDYVKIVILINNLLISLSYPLNFGIYCGMSRQFRETFKELFIHSVTRRGSPSLQLVRFLTLYDINISSLLTQQ